MTHFGISVERGDVDRRLGQLAVFMQDLRPFWPLIVPVVTGWWRSQFATEGAFGGKPWARLSPTYAAQKAIRYPGRGILVATGGLKQAASRPQRSQTPTSLTLTINDAKLQFHQQGTPRMPARPLVFGGPLPPLADAEISLAADKYVRDLLNRI